jgi:hypothetical protein
MVEAYRVPKREVVATVTLVGRPPEPLHLYLFSQAEAHAGPERPSDLLNGPDEFFPARDPSGMILFIPRDSVIRAAVPASCEPAEYKIDEEAYRTAELFVPPMLSATIEVECENGDKLAGVVEYGMPEGRGRLQDFLNTGFRFLGVRQGDTLHLINKRRITRIARLGGGEGRP